MKKIFIISLLVAIASALELGAVTLKEKYGSFSVIGDSYSTFMGFTEPLDNAQWYPHDGNAMASVGQTWWKLFERATGVVLEQNNSYSGSTICTHSWNNTTDLTNSFVGRVDNLRNAGLIIVEGATNDNNAGSTLGDYVWSDFSDAQKRTFRGGTAYVIDFLQKKYPEAQIVFMLNSQLRSDINESVAAICNHYNVPLLRLHDITKIEDHPDIPGMLAIKEQLIELLCGLNGMTYISEDSRVNVAEDISDAAVMVNKRMAADRWNSFCVPFAMDANAVDACFGEGSRIQRAVSFEGSDIAFAECEGVEANAPCLVMPSREIDSPFYLEHVNLVKSAPVAVGEGNVVTGIYTSTSAGSTRKPVYSFSGMGAAYNALGQGISFAPLSVVIKTQGQLDLNVSLENYTAPRLPELTFAEAFTPAHDTAPLSGAVPVIAADPFFNLWCHGGEATAGSLKHITGSEVAFNAYMTVDGTLFRIMGAGSSAVEKRITNDGDSDVSVAVQTGCSVTATQTYFTFEAGNVGLSLVFSSPQLIDDASTLEAAVNYITYQARSLDGAPHEVAIYLAPSSDMVRHNSSGSITVFADTSEGVTFGKVGAATQNISESNRSDWGYMLLMADASRGQEMVLNSKYLLFSDNLGAVKDAVSGYTLIGRDENDMAIGFGYARFPAPWVLRFPSFTRLMMAYADEVNSRLEACRNFDSMIYDDAMESGGKSYARLCSGLYRQVMSGCKQAVSDTGDILLYNIDAGNTWQISQADQLFAAAPLFLVYNPSLAYALFEGVPDYIKMYPWFSSPYGNAPHHLGAWPVMAGSHLDYGVDSTTDLCILAGAAVKLGVDASSISDYSYNYLKSLCNYLDLFTLPQYVGNFPGEGSADGAIRDNASLRLKSVLSMALVAYIAGERGDVADQEFYSEMAGRWEDIFRNNFDEGDHFRQGVSVEWGQKYPLFYDYALGLGIFEDVISTELAYYSTVADGDYGIPLDARSATDAKVSAMMLTGALADNFSVYAAPVVDYVGKEGNNAPVADRYNCATGAPVSGSGSVALGSVWGKVLLNRLGLSGVTTVEADAVVATGVKGVYDLQGRQLSGALQPGIYIIDGVKTVVR
ncbi:MAG: DUF5127 domain-containing protein [Bacteroidales bacterium]|nr:DUF5127 domain-containing protein [Bacteroidales bacterium]